MVRRHLAASIALTAILSLVAGGLAYAALTPEGKVTACASPDGFIRSANYNGKKCPSRTTPVLLDKSVATPTPTPGSGDGVGSPVASDDPASATFKLATPRGPGDPPSTKKTHGTATFTVQTAGFYQALFTAKMSYSGGGNDQFGTCTRFEEQPGFMEYTHEVRGRITGEAGDTHVPRTGPAQTLTSWLEPGNYTAELSSTVYTCTVPIFDDPEVTVTDMHIRVFKF